MAVLRRVGVDDVGALHFGAGGAEGFPAEGEAQGLAVSAEVERPALRADGEVGAGGGGEEGAVEVPPVEEEGELVEGEAFPDAAEVEDAPGFQAGDGGGAGVDGELAGGRGGGGRGVRLSGGR